MNRRTQVAGYIIAFTSIEIWVVLQARHRLATPTPPICKIFFWMCGVRRWWDICGQKEEESRM